MFVYPYDTTICSGHPVSNLIKVLKTTEVVEGLHSNPQSQITDSLNNINLHQRNIVLVTGLNKDVPPFAHPLSVDFVNGKKLVIDARSFTKVNNKDVVVSSDNEYKFNIIRALLTEYLSLTPSHAKDLLSLGTFPMLVYSRWIAENVSKRMGLNPAEQAKLVVVAAFFYNSLFREDPVFTDVELSRLVQQIGKVTYIPIDICQEVADNILPMSNMKEFVSQIIHVVDSPRLEKFSTGLLMTILLNSWYGTNSKEIVCVAIEHAPTWMALIYSALNDRSYRNSGLGKVVLNNDKKEMGKSFTMNLLNLVS